MQPHASATNETADRRPGPRTLQYLCRLLRESIAAGRDAKAAEERSRRLRRAGRLCAERCADGEAHRPANVTAQCLAFAALAASDRLRRAEERLARDILDGGAAEDRLCKRRQFRFAGGSGASDGSTEVITADATWGVA